MKVNINNTEIDYVSDYSRNNSHWKIKNRDAFTFIRLNGINCFIKRSNVIPSSWLLLKQLKHQPSIGRPAIYDAIRTTEKGKKVYYHFTEKLEGETLAEAIAGGKFINISFLLDDISNALSHLHKNNFWFSDLNEENIFRGSDGRYYLIDLDSCWKKDIKPNPISNAKGGLPGKAQVFTRLIDDFYNKVLKYPNYSFDTLSGANLNYLQLIGIVTKVNYFYRKLNKDLRFSYSLISFTNDDLHHHLHSINPRFSKGIFTKALDIPLTAGMVKAIKEHVAVKRSDVSSIDNEPTLPKKATPKTPSQTNKKAPAKKASRTTSFIKPILIGASLLFTALLGNSLYNTYAFNKAVERGDLQYNQQELGQALISYETALEYKNKESLINQRKEKVEKASLDFFNDTIQAIEELIDDRSYDSAATKLGEIESSIEYTPYIQDSIQLRREKIRAYEMREKADTYAFSDLPKDIQQAIPIYEKSLEIYYDAATAVSLKKVRKKADDLNRKLVNKALILACTNNDFPSVKAALAENANANIKDQDKLSMLLLAVANQNLDIVKALVKAGANCKHQTGYINIENQYFSNPITVAAMLGHTDILKHLVEKGKADVNLLDQAIVRGQKTKGWTALGAAVFAGHLDIVNYLIEKKATPNVLQGQQQITPLMLAAQAGHFNITKTLVEAGANIGFTDAKGQDVYHYASTVEIRNYLQKKGLGKSSYFNSFEGRQTDFPDHHSNTGRNKTSAGILYFDCNSDSYMQTESFNLNFKKDFIIKSDVNFSNKSQNEKAAFGIIFGGDHANKNFHLFLLDANGSCLYFTYENGKWSPTLPWNAKHPTQGINKIRIEKSGSTVTFKINGKNVGSVSVNHYFGNRIGFYAQEGMKVEIYDLEVVGLRGN